MSNRIVTTKNYKIGDKVVRGRDFKDIWNEQDKGSVYGVIDSIYEKYSEDAWVYVNWVDYKGKVINRRDYRIGPSFFDLYFYEK